MKTISVSLFGFFAALIGISPCPAADPPAEGKAAIRRPDQAGWVQAAGAGGFALGIERIRSQLGLSGEQERKIVALVEESSKLWKDHLQASMAGRDELGAEVLAILTEAQREQLEELKSVEGSWFTFAGNAYHQGALDLGKETEAKIEEIITAHRKERTVAFQSVAKADPDAAKKAKEFQERHRKLLDEAKGKMREILSPEQFDTLVTEVARSQFQSIGQQKRYAKELGLSGEQVEKLSAWSQERTKTAREIGQIKDAEERMAKWNAWREEAGTKAFDILIDTQKEAVKELPSVEGMWFSSLSWPGMIGKLGAGDGAKEKIQKALEDYKKKRSEAYRPSPEVAAKSREVQAKYKKMVEEAKAEIRSVLTDEQFDTLLAKIARTQIPYLYTRPNVVEALGLSEGQSKQIKEIVQKGNSRIRERAKEVSEERLALQKKAEAILTPEQREKLEKTRKMPRPTIRVRAGEGAAGKK